MSALKIQTSLNEIERTMSKIAPHRNFALFDHFLINGYAAITLDSVPQSRFSDLLRAKLCLGTLITLYDDFADRPAQADAALLELLYKLRFGKRPSVRSKEPFRQDVIEFANSLFTQIEDVLKPLANYKRLIDILNFDLSQFYSANRYSSLLVADPSIHNRLENRLYAHHNMGMVMVATMDLMASETIDFVELGSMREAFLMGQRLGRIFNVLATRKREVLDGDITGELSACKSEHELKVGERSLRQEIFTLREKLADLDTSITTFSMRAYLQGLTKVQELHEKMEGII
jgi:hypothetical protein